MQCCICGIHVKKDDACTRTMYNRTLILCKPHYQESQKYPNTLAHHCRRRGRDSCPMREKSHYCTETNDAFIKHFDINVYGYSHACCNGFTCFGMSIRRKVWDMCKHCNTTQIVYKLLPIGCRWNPVANDNFRCTFKQPSRNVLHYKNYNPFTSSNNHDYTCMRCHTLKYCEHFDSLLFHSDSVPCDVCHKQLCSVCIISLNMYSFKGTSCLECLKCIKTAYASLTRKLPMEIVEKILLYNANKIVLMMILLV